MSEYKHKEAFCLMWYGCPCGHRELMWNSRDGVTPFGTLCPSCDEPSLEHVWWNQDLCKPDHKPAPGQRVWVSMTQAEAARHAEARIASAKAQGDERERSKKVFEALVAHIYQDGEAPDLVVTGYRELPPERSTKVEPGHFKLTVARHIGFISGFSKDDHNELRFVTADGTEWTALSTYQGEGKDRTVYVDLGQLEFEP